MLIGLSCALAAAFAWMFANATIQAASVRFGALGAVIWAQLSAAPVVVLAALALEGLPPDPGAVGWVAAAVAGVAACAAYVGLFEALREGQLAVVIPITSGWAVISVVVAVVGFDEPLGTTRAGGVALVAGGNILLASTVGGGKGQPGGTSVYAAAMAGLSALGFGVLVPATDVSGEALGRLWTVPVVWGLELLIAVPLALRRRLVGGRPTSARDWLVAGRVGLFEAVGFVALSVGLGFAPVGVVSPVASLSTGLSVLWGVVILRERLRRRALAGALLASVGVVLVGL